MNLLSNALVVMAKAFNIKPTITQRAQSLWHVTIATGQDALNQRRQND